VQWPLGAAASRRAGRGSAAPHESISTTSPPAGCKPPRRSPARWVTRSSYSSKSSVSALSRRTRNILWKWKSEQNARSTALPILW
jgi:hypothetical protein